MPTVASSVFNTYYVSFLKTLMTFAFPETPVVTPAKSLSISAPHKGSHSISPSSSQNVDVFTCLHPAVGPSKGWPPNNAPWSTSRTIESRGSWSGHTVVGSYEV